MKKITCLIALLTIIAGCKKKYCWECITITSGGSTGRDTATICNETEESIKGREGTTSATDTVGGKRIRVIYETTCSKQ